MHIIAAGMNRSGSTWQFNAVRCLAVASWPERLIQSCWIESYKGPNPYVIQVVKAHGRDQLKASSLLDDQDDIIVTSYRDLRAVIGSLFRMNWLWPHDVMEYLDIYVNRLSAWEKSASVSLKYEDMIVNPKRSLRDLAHAIGVSTNEQTLQSAMDGLDALEPPSDSWDQVTQLHVRHIGEKTNAPAIARVPHDLLVKIEAAYEGWLVERGYTLCC